MNPALKASVFALLLVGCASVDYIGKSYAPTPHCEILFSLDDIARPYEVMGVLTAEAPEGVSLQDIQEDLLEEARARGGDAMVIEDLGKVESSYNTQSTTTDVLHHGKPTGSSTNASTTISRATVVQAKLLKYKG